MITNVLLEARIWNELEYHNERVSEEIKKFSERGSREYAEGIVETYEEYVISPRNFLQRTIFKPFWEAAKYEAAKQYLNQKIK